MSDELPIPGTDGKCACCGSPDARHSDPDLGFVCSSCLGELISAGVTLRIASKQDSQPNDK